MNIHVQVPVRAIRACHGLVLVVLRLLEIRFHALFNSVAFYSSPKYSDNAESAFYVTGVGVEHILEGYGGFNVKTRQ